MNKLIAHSQTETLWLLYNSNRN